MLTYVHTWMMICLSLDAYMLMQLDAHALTCYDDRAYAKVIKRYHECVLKAYLLMCLYVRMLC